MRAAIASRPSRVRLDLDGVQWWLRLATNLPPTTSTARLFATRCARSNEKHLGPFGRHSLPPARKASTERRREALDTRIPSAALRFSPPPLGGDKPDSLNITRWLPQFASLTPQDQHKVSSRQQYIFFSDLERWLVAENAQDGDKAPRPDVASSDEAAKAAVDEQPAPQSNDAATRPELNDLSQLSDSQLRDHCRELASQGGALDELIAHFEREAKVAGKQRATELASEQLTRAQHRRRIALQALLTGFAERKPHDVQQRHKIRPHDARFSEIAGIEALVLPSQLLRIHALLCDVDGGAPSPPTLYDSIPPEACHMLATRIAISQRPQLFGVFFHMMKRVQAASDYWSRSLSDPRELTFILQYCLHESLWSDQGGARVAQDIFQLLLSRPENAEALGDVEDEAKAWLPNESRRSVMIHLFAHLLLVRQATRARLPAQAVRACEDALRRFGGDASATTTSKAIWSTARGLLGGDGDARRDGHGRDLSECVFQNVRGLLARHSHALRGGARTSSSASTLEAFCRYALYAQKSPQALQTLHAFVGDDATLADVVRAQTFISLLDSAPAASRRAISPVVHALLGVSASGSSVAREPLVRDLPASLRRSLIAALCRLEMGPAAANLFLHWIQTDEVGRVDLYSDASVLANLVRELARRSGGEGEGGKQEELLPAATAGGSALQRLLALPAAPLRAPADCRAFCRTLLAAFQQVKPYAQRKHHDLTALASAHFALGDYTQGFALFRRLLQTRHVPDAADLTVLLRVIADADASRAVELYARYLDAVRGGGGGGETGGETNASTADPSAHPSFLGGLRGNYQALNLLLERCFDQGTSIGPLLHLIQRQPAIDTSARHGESLALTVPIVAKAWNARDARREWPELARMIQSAVGSRGGRRAWRPPASFAVLMVEAAVNGLTLRQLYARQRERDEYRMRVSRGDGDGNGNGNDGGSILPRTRRSSPGLLLYTYLREPMPDALWQASLDVLEAMEECTASTSFTMLQMYLQRFFTLAGLNSRGSGGGSSSSEASRHVADLDRFVGVIRRVEARVANVAKSPSQTTTQDTPSARTLLNPIVFRSLIRLYLAFGDIQGASEVFLWMKEWFQAGSFRRRSGGKKTGGTTTTTTTTTTPFSGREIVRFGLGDKLAKEAIEPLLGDLEVLERDQVPSWTFEGSKIEKTKRWWAAAAAAAAA